MKLPYIYIALFCMFAVNAYAYDLTVENADGKTIYYNYINDGTYHSGVRRICDSHKVS